ncbi:MAG: hypothetical protein JOZ74_12050 [Bradyrhizobium sp.]|nr:hypothetical protein [Bradyrhizobium sp.]
MRLHPGLMNFNAMTRASLPILACKLRWQFEKMIILQIRAERVLRFQEPASRSQIITVAPAREAPSIYCDPCFVGCAVSFSIACGEAPARRGGKYERPFH